MAGRKRAFDRDEVLDRITMAFWRDGFAATSVADLTALTGVNPPSLYAAFGDKRALFDEAVRHYTAAYGGFIVAALREEPTSRLAIRRLLREAAAEYTRPGRPPGCLVLHAPELAEQRRATAAMVEEKIRHDVRGGALPGTADPHALALLVSAVMRGMSDLARDGATEAELADVAEAALSAWPAPVP
ncbi:AcrR family transcriptional regulator [Saccharothrix coeruleofusca]|uniref:TetR/AcrR family transcriptional regulator n=1 Tax=Saccharothrix coeruleofusca TaxID=33919 RepID=UPI001AE91F08|nr:TetR/AcrR family transcriptional regulator [Saccharothrix coeruleofusca]MBP2340736.1 AcrR family transcriptional regulator [Saccharothrix coeruleofusca]